MAIFQSGAARPQSAVMLRNARLISGREIFLLVSCTDVCPARHAGQPCISSELTGPQHMPALKDNEPEPLKPSAHDARRAVPRPSDIFMWRHSDGNTGRTRRRTVPGAQFLCLVLRHVLPKGFPRARNFGFLHPNSKRLIALPHLLLKFVPTSAQAWVKPRAPILRSRCGTVMTIVRTRIRSVFPAPIRPTAEGACRSRRKRFLAPPRTPLRKSAMARQRQGPAPSPPSAAVHWARARHSSDGDAHAAAAPGRRSS